MPPKKYYVVWAGRSPGIYTQWPEAERQIKGFAGARFKSFSTLTEAEQAYGEGKTAAAPRPAARRAEQTPVAEETRAAVEIYCDGACDPNPGPSGTGVVIYRDGELDQLWYGLYNPAGTNNTAELLGLYHALAFARKFITSGHGVAILCDSKYAIECVTNWAFGWKARGWKRRGGEIMNLDLIQPAHALYTEIAEHIRVRHVAGHSGVEGNELADRMSVVAIRRRETALRRFTEAMSPAAIMALAKG